MSRGDVVVAGVGVPEMVKVCLIGKKNSRSKKGFEILSRSKF